MILDSMLDHRPWFLFGLTAVMVGGYIVLRLVQRLRRGQGRQADDERRRADEISPLE